MCSEAKQKTPLPTSSPAALPGVVTLLFFFVFLGIAFILDKYFSKTGVDADVAEVHRQLPGEQSEYDAVKAANKRGC